MKGKLIVIEGGDGSGKATQTKLLAEKLRAKNISVETLSFPRYSDSFYGKVVGRYMAGEFGSLDQVSPYLAAIPYALDRFDARDTIKKWLQTGKIVIIDRYVPSAMAHQAAKVPPKEQNTLIKWIEEMEYTENKLPLPDLIVYLHVPATISKQLAGQKTIDRGYKQKLDIAEKHKDHLEKTEKIFLRLVSERGWKKIECMDNEKLRTIEDIHNELLKLVISIIR